MRVKFVSGMHSSTINGVQFYPHSFFGLVPGNWGVTFTKTKGLKITGAVNQLVLVGGCPCCSSSFFFCSFSFFLK
jgi:hypothetical protein